MNVFIRLDDRQLLNVNEIESIVISKSRVNTLRINLKANYHLNCQYKAEINVRAAFNELTKSLAVVDITAGMIYHEGANQLKLGDVHSEKI